MTLAYVTKLDFTTQKTIVKVQIIYDFLLNTYGITLTMFLLQNSFKKVQFFEKIFLLTNTRIEVILEIVFFFFSNADIIFAK